MKLIATDRISPRLRERGVRVSTEEILITNLNGSKQAQDLTLPPNCEGLGRRRHFRREQLSKWRNPLPIEPAAQALGKPPGDQIIAQVFQNAVCNWRCWYCFVDFDRLAGNENLSRWVTADQLVELYNSEKYPAEMIDLSGGQPDLTPEWIYWMMRSLRNAGLADKIYLWSDDNLSNDYFWKYLSKDQIAEISNYSMYGRVACFKGIDRESFAFNTLAGEEGYDYQFECFRRLLDTGIDLFAYVTFTVPDDKLLETRVARFVDRLQGVDPNLPLRTVPLQVSVFKPVEGRLNDLRRRSLEIQQEVIELWHAELGHRFSDSQRAIPISEVSVGPKVG